jgi:prepilin-type N-terminal cleavage/methylation domain-containing protein
MSAARPAHAGTSACETEAGFTLTELAVVLVVVALLTGGLLVSLSTQREIQQIQETQTTLATAREALLGYAAARGRLPCPATGVANSGVAAPDTGSDDCAADANDDHFLPAVTLGIGPTDSRGYLVDAWNNPVRYRLTAYNAAVPTEHWTYAKNGRIKTVGMANLAPDLRVCSTRNCAAGTVLVANSVAVVFSTGRNGASVPAIGTDEAENRDNDLDFVSRTSGSDGASTYDDLVIWLSPNILYSKMMTAGQLP